MRPASIVAALFALLACAACVACSSSSSGAASCDGTDHASCSGTFTCGNGGITLACDATTQVCVVSPGSVYCETVAGASASHCPSPTDAKNLSGCTQPFHAVCSGGSGSGITVTCKQ
jgi:hypothetical protein